MDASPTLPRMDKKRLIRRRVTFFTAVFLLTSLATWFMADLLWGGDGLHGLEWALLGLFVVLFAQIALGFVMALLGFYVINRGGDTCRISLTVPDDDPNPPLAGTAVVMPVFNEDVSRVFEGVRVIFESLRATGRLEHFDFFILSDSNQPNQWIQEEVAWVELCKQVGGFGKIFYRKRRNQINKKAGNVADFLRRWGKSYRYMIVLDADSIMTGSTMVQLVAQMERNPRVGLIQTAPRLVNSETLYGRLQQFANRLYSPVFLAGLNYWQQHDANYWGHNAVIRVQPFIEHCALPDLPGKEPFGGRILSHDFVEAALMRKAGWAVWMAHDLPGTYEEGPPTLIDSAKRDRRWAQGNLQHTWLLAARGIPPISRLHMLLGVMSYVTSPLWLLFLVVSSIEAFNHAASPAAGLYGPVAHTMLLGFKVNLPVAVTLFILTLFMLFLPKVLGVVVAWQTPGVAAGFGGRGKMVASALVETAISALLAPINMLFHAKFVAFTLVGQGVAWVTQRRGNEETDGTDWREAILTHGEQTLFGLVWGFSAFVLLRPFFWWLSPVLAGLVLSIPLSILLSKNSLGSAARRWGLFLVPDEVAPPPEIARLHENLALCHRHLRPLEPLRADYGLLQAVLDPYVNAVHVSLLRQRRASEESRDWLAQLRRRLLADGPDELTTREKSALLADAESMIELHRDLWRRPGSALAEWWRLALRQYNVLTAAPITALYR